MNQKSTIDQALLNCSKEPIHIPGAIQPHGVLFAVENGTLKVSDFSSNIESTLGVAPREILNRPMSNFIPTSGLGPLIRQEDFIADVPVRVVARVNTDLRCAIRKIQSSQSLLKLCQEGCEGVKTLTGLDRVMTYRFHPDEHGEVIAEAKTEDLPKYLGLHYPASDIPRQTREMFLKNWIRMIPERDYVPVPLMSILEDRNFLFWFRPKVTQSVTWAGNPEKPVSCEADRARISPRTSP
jgi:two-component system, chemotaxis family, sensor kinase Cph1